MSVQEIDLNKPDEEVINLLEDILEQAKKGEIQSVALVYSWGNMWTNNAWAGMNKNNMAIIGEAACLQQELLDCFTNKRKMPIFYEDL